MVQHYSCAHLASSTTIPLSTILNSKDTLQCADCDCHGPNLWICLHKNCLQIGCAEKSNDHSTIHNTKNPAHCVHMNLSTQRIWCYECKREVFMDPSSYFYNDSDQEMESCGVRSRDSGHGSYSTLRTSTPERGHIFENSVGLNVGMSGDGNASDSSDGEDYNYTVDSRPFGLVGLQNIGNTCYMNAALQALSNTEPLTKFFIDCAYIVQFLSEGRKPGLSRTYQALIRDIWIKRTNQGYVTPSGILYGIRNVHAMFRGYHQHDTQEFLRNFMDQLHEELKQLASPDSLSMSDSDTFSLAMDDPALSSSYDSSEGEYETCDSGVSERSSLSDDMEKPSNSTKRRLSRCGSPNRRQRQRIQNSSVVDSQPTSSSCSSSNPKKQIKYRSIISDIFDGKLLSSVQCLTCDRVSSRVETFQDLSLPIPSRDHLVVLHGRTTAPGVTCSDAVMPVQDGWISWILAWLRSWFYGPTITLHDCLSAFFSTDELKGDNMYSCEKCNKLRNGIKFSKVLQLPEVLCIHLKRFRHELMFSSKISSAVSFPLKGLDMRPYLHGDCVSKVSNYELYSVICHHGTAGGGHYTCFAQNSGQWYEFDDQYVTKVSAERVQTCEAYVLFYRKVQTSAEVVRNKVTKMANIAEEITRLRISRQWLNRFYYCAEPGPIDNTDFLCHHGAINPDRDLVLDHFACVVPLEVYEYLYKKFGGCPPANNLGICLVCTAQQKRLLREMEMFVQISREAQNQDWPHSHYLSTTWYTQWHNFVQKNNQEPPGLIDNSKINVNNLDLNEAAEVPECIWKFFHNIYGGGPEVRIKGVHLTSGDGQDADIPSEEEEGDANYAFVIPKARKQQNELAVAHNDTVVCDFVIPNINKDSSNMPNIDKSLYCSGEPMETDSFDKNSENLHVINKARREQDQSAAGLDDIKTEKCLENGSLLRCTNGMSNNAKLPNADDDIDEEESHEIRKNKRHRRRRKYLLSS